MIHKQPPVLILAAGAGRRMGSDFNWLPKALLPLEKRAILSHIFDRFELSQKLYIAVAKGNQIIKDYCEIYHGDRHISYIEIENHGGPNSGPGMSTFHAIEHIGSAFYLVCCDTLWEEKLPENTTDNWIGCSEISFEDSTRYCLVKEQNRRVTGLVDKPQKPLLKLKAFNGLAYIFNWELFRDGLEQGFLNDSQESQLAPGFLKLIDEASLETFEMKTWKDVGIHENYINERSLNENIYNIKSDEAFYCYKAVVTKAHSSHLVTQQKYLRAQELVGLIPEDLIAKKNMISYKYVQGRELSHYLEDEKILIIFLDWCKKNLWKKSLMDKEEFKHSSYNFYKNETRSRILLLMKQSTAFSHTFPEYEVVVHQQLDSLSESARACNFHGDLQTENILVTGPNSFCLIDWRHDYGGLAQCGDIRYDLAKLQMSLRYDFNSLNSSRGLNFNFIPKRKNDSFLVNVIEDYCNQNEISWKEICLIEAIIFLRMSALHPEPLKEFLWRESFKKLDSFTNSSD